MACLWTLFLEAFWAEYLWLPNGYKWEHIQNGPDKKIVYPDYELFLYQVPLVLIILTLRYTLKKLCYEPLGRAITKQNTKCKRPQYIPLLELAYRRSTKLKDTVALAKQLDMDEREIKLWWRLRRSADKPSTLDKFCEYAWHATYSGINTLIGLYVLWDKDYFWDFDQCVVGYPHQGVTKDVWWFYAINFSIVCTSVITVFFEVRRKDFMLLLLHHLLEAILYTVAWITCLFRLGAVVIPIMESSDSLLQINKACKLTKYDSASPIIFIFFSLLWFYTRMYIFPFYYMYSATITTYALLSMCVLYVLMNSMLLLLLLLQLYWSFLLMQVWYNCVSCGDARDIRSSSSELSDSESPDKCDKQSSNDIITIHDIY